MFHFFLFNHLIIYNEDYSLLFSYSFENLFTANGDLTMGLKLNLNRLNQNESFYPFYDFSESVYKESWAVGAIYNIKYGENKSIRFGLAFESEIRPCSPSPLFTCLYLSDLAQGRAE